MGTAGARLALLGEQVLELGVVCDEGADERAARDDALTACPNVVERFPDEPRSSGGVLACAISTDCAETRV
jgi:hypothetical protein